MGAKSMHNSNMVKDATPVTAIGRPAQTRPVAVLASTVEHSPVNATTQKKLVAARTDGKDRRRACPCRQARRTAGQRLRPSQWPRPREPPPAPRPESQPAPP